MTKKDFIAVAEIINNVQQGGFDIFKQVCETGTAKSAVVVIAEELAAYFKRQNPRFDTQRFLDACGVK